MDKREDIKKKEEGRKHLPVYGPGPVYCGGIIALTFAAFLLRDLPLLEKGKTDSAIFTVIGIIFILSGIALWIYAVPVSKIDDGILNNRLVTAGAYALVRNPIYTAVMFACIGVLFLMKNLFFLILPLFYWIYMTVLMKNTEEKWLLKLYGKEYEEYCRRVNRCWPWFPR